MPLHRRIIPFVLCILAMALCLPATPGAAQATTLVRVIVALRAPAAAGQSAVVARAAIAQAQNRFAPVIAAAGAREITRLQSLPYLVLETPRSGLARLAAEPQVALIAEDTPMAAHLTNSIPLVRADQAQLVADGAGASIAILDTGVEASHSFFGGRVIAEACFSTNSASPNTTSLCPGAQFQVIAAGAAAPCGLSGCDHGTHVAGIAAGGAVDRRGVAPGASLIAVQVFSRFNSSAQCGATVPCVLSFTSDQLRALDWLATTEFDPPLAAVNMSLGFGAFSNVEACETNGSGVLLKSAIAQLRAQDIVTVASAGNNFNSGALSMPACLSNVVSVGATTTTQPDQVLALSNSAPFLTLLAPGESITSSVPGGGFAGKTGTSMAAPHVAGAIALLNSAQPDTPADLVVTLLVDSGVPVTDPRNGLTKPRLDVLAALNRLLAIAPRAYLPVVSSN